MPTAGATGLISQAEAKQRGNRGRIRALEGTYNGTKLYVTSWADNRAVNVLATFPTQKERVVRKTKDPQSGAFMKISIERPVTMEIYNHGMGGTDLEDHDAMIAYYRTVLKMKKWPARIIFHTKQAQTCNSRVIYNKQGARLYKGFKPLPLKVYLTSIFVVGQKKSVDSTF